MPCNYNDYPDNWKTWIVPQIAKRSEGRCEWCGKVNYSHYTGAKGQQARVILTVAHLDHDLSNNDGMERGGLPLPLSRANLVHLCQPCHLKHDAKLHARTRAENKRKEELKNQPELF